jgi:protein SCO1/2
MNVIKTAVILSVILALPLSAPAQTLSGQAPHAAGQEINPRVGIEEHLDTTIPLADLTFTDEDGNPVVLADLFGKPVILTLVYFSCPGICTPLLNELSRVVQQSRMVPGKDFRMVTISFDPDEGFELARLKRINMLGAMEQNVPAPEDWRFLVGDEENIRKIVDAVGFRFVRDKNGIDFVHAASVMFLSPEGKIVRYLNTTRFNPADLEMAVIDAAEGRSRSLMQKVERLCYAYDPEGQAYVLKINRIILGITLVFVLLFVGFLVLRKPAARRPPAGSEGAAS